MIRWVWWTALLAIALITTAAEIDRASARRPQLAGLVPAPFRGFAQPSFTLAALANSGPQDALREARALVRRRPAPAENLYMLALADLRVGDVHGYAAAFEAATSRGWRTLPIQIAAADAAIARSDAAAAASRVVALWQVQGPDPQVLALTRRLLALPNGPETFGRLVAGTSMTPEYLRQNLVPPIPFEQTERVLAAARSAGVH